MHGKTNRASAVHLFTSQFDAGKGTAAVGAAAIISSLVIGCVSLSYSDRLFQNARLRGPVFPPSAI
jgi:hypothetical protein